MMRHAMKWVAGAIAGRELTDPAHALSDHVLDWVGDQGVLPLLESRLRRDTNAWEQLPEAIRTRLTNGVRHAVAYELYRRSELRRLDRLFARHELRVVLLKGDALAQWLYPERHLRLSDDIDLLLSSREQAQSAATACSELGYQMEYMPSETNHEMTARLVVDGISRSELDLHSRLLNSPGYADIFSFDELWVASMPLPTIGDGMRALSPPHALAHACLNRALDMQIGAPDRLKLLYDIHLLIERMDAPAWREFVAMAESKRICGICLRSIGDTIAAFDSAAPAGELQALRDTAGHEPLDWRRLHDWRYMQLQNFKALPGSVAKIRWLWQRLFMSTGALRAQYGDGSWLRLMGRRIWRGIVRLRG